MFRKQIELFSWNSKCNRFICEMKINKKWISIRRRRRRPKKNDQMISQSHKQLFLLISLHCAIFIALVCVFFLLSHHNVRRQRVFVMRIWSDKNHTYTAQLYHLYHFSVCVQMIFEQTLCIFGTLSICVFVVPVNSIQRFGCI